MNNESIMVNIVEKISPDLALRNVADSFADWLEALLVNKVTIDFNGVRSISRSFAHQYIQRKNASHKIINEINMPVNVEKMLKIVQSPSPKTDIVNFDSIRIVTV